MKTHAFRVYQHGNPSVMFWEEVDLPDPGRGEVLIRHTAIGVNLVDSYMRYGLYPGLTPPSGLGVEAAGVIEAVGRGVKDFKAGNRVAYAGGAPPGAYAEARVRGTGGLVKLPGWLDERTAAAALAKGRTVEYLFNRTHKLKKGETILFHAAAGGVGLIACQWARAVGATVIGTVSTDDKAALAKRHGCRHPINVKKQDLVAEVARITKGRGVDVVYDSIGLDLWRATLECVRPLGLVVSFGSASGPPPPFDVQNEGMRKSIYLTRATTANYMTGDDIIKASTQAVFRMIKSGAVKIRVGQTYALEDARDAHRDLEGRRTTGSSLLIP